MKEIETLGRGCAKCTKVAELIQSVAADCRTSVKVVKETSPEVIMNYGVMTTPAIVVNSVLVHSGPIPDRKQIEGWLN